MIGAPRVFVSRPSHLTARQLGTYERWRALIARHGLEPVELRRPDYQAVPWGHLRRLVAGADGVLVLGFARAREGDETPWNHLEAGLGLMAELPLLVAVEDGVAGGIFAPDTWRGGVEGTLLSAPDEETVGAWAKTVWRRSVSPRGSRRASRGRPSAC